MVHEIASMGDNRTPRLVSIEPPDLSVGFGMARWVESGLWPIILICAHGAFMSWAQREVEVCRKPGMGCHLPFAFGGALFAYTTLVVIRPGVICSAHHPR